MLVICPGCGKRVSDRAPACPFCKAPRQAEAPLVIPPPAAVAVDAPAPGRGEQRLPVAPPPVDSLPSFAPGDFIGSSMQVLRVLGEGGFGVVYLVHSLETRTLHALKTLRPELLRDEASRELFRREAAIWIALGRHPYLVRAHHLAEVHGRFFLAMEYVAPDARGLNSLDGHLARHAPALTQSLRWAIQCCLGLEYAYSRGVKAHRDLKPANILVAEDGNVRLTDFGIASLVTRREDRGVSFGTPTHMAPEQFVDAADCDERSDVYSFGIVLHQLVAQGRPPFLPAAPIAGPDRAAKLWQVFARLHREAPLPKLDSPLAPIIARCLRKEPAARYPGFAALRADLERLYAERAGQPFKPASRVGLEAWELSNQGNSLGNLGRWEEALAQFDRALAAAPQNPQIHNNRGNALRHLGRTAEAVEAFERAIALDPAFAAPWLNKGLALADDGSDADAIGCFDRAAALDPRMADAWISRGVLLGRLGRHDEELASYDRAIEADPREPLAWFNKGNTLHAAGRAAEAVACFDRCLASDPRNIKAWEAKGIAVCELGHPAAAVRFFDEALRLEPANGQAWYNRGNALAAAGDMAEARRSFAEAVRHAPQFPLCWYNLGLAELQLGRPAEASAPLQRFLAIAPPDHPFRPVVDGLLARIAAGDSLPTIGGVGTTVDHEGRERGKVEVQEPQAPDQAGGGGAIRGEGSPVHENDGVGAGSAAEPSPRALLAGHNDRCTALFGQGRFAEALAAAEDALRIDPRNATGLNNRANCLFRLGRGDDALATHERLLLGDPSFVAGWVNKGMIEHALGRDAEARRSLRDGIAFAGATDEAYAGPARKTDADLARRGVVPAPPDALSHLGAAVRSGWRGRWDESLAALDQAIAARPRCATLWRWKGEALAEAGQPLSAVAAYDQALSLEGRDAATWHVRGKALARAQRLEEAVASFDRAVAEEPGHVASWNDRGKALGALGRLEESIESLGRAVALAPEAAPPWQNKALAEDQLGRTADALRSYRAFLSRATPQMASQARHAEARVVFLEAQLRAAPVAAAAAGTAVTEPVPAPPPSAPAAAGAASEELPEPKVPAVSAALPPEESLRQATILVNQGQLEKALPLLDQAIAADPGSPRGWAARGEVLRRLRLPGEAAAHFRKAAGIDPRTVRHWQGLAASLDALGRRADALAAWDRAAEIAPADKQTWNGRGLSLHADGRVEEALASFDRALGIDPRFALARYNLGVTLEALGRGAEAARALQQFLAIAPPQLGSLVQQARVRLERLRAR